MKPKILFITGTKHASSYYRMRLPAYKLNDLGYEVDEAFFTTVDPVTLLATDSSGNVIDLKKANVIVFQMVWYDALLIVIRKAKRLGIKIFMDIDDNYRALPANNPAFNNFHPKTQLMQDKDGNKVFMRQRQQMKLTHTRYGEKYVRDRKAEETTNFAINTLEEAMKLVDVIQVSTPELKEVYQAYNNNVVVLPNCVDPEEYVGTKQPKTIDDIVTIGWYGTKTHADDLALVDGCIPDNCKLVLIGVEDVVENEKLFRNVKNLELRPIFGDICNIASAISDIDIGLCPLVDNQFNGGKSELKAIEFNSLGIPVIASDVAPYSRYVRHGENGLLVKGNKTKFWIRYINQLINDNEMRQQMSNKAIEIVKEKDISNNIHLWEKAYNDNRAK